MKTAKAPLAVVFLACAACLVLLPSKGLPPSMSFVDAMMRNDSVQLKRSIAWGAAAWRGENGLTALHDAAMLRPEAVKLLIADGADVNAKDSFGRTPLHMAASMGRTDTASLLVAGGAGLNAWCRLAGTPLHNAVVWGRPTMVAWLIAKGADVNMKDVRGHTPLDVALRLDKSEIADLLREHGGERSTPGGPLSPPGSSQ